MDELNGFSERDADRLLSGREPLSEGNEDLVALLSEMREALHADPSKELERAHLARMASAALEAQAVRVTPSSAPPARRSRGGRPRSRLKLALSGAGLLLALPLSSAGLAATGVDLPDAAKAPFDAVGIDLPNQSRADDVKGVIDAHPPRERGCEFGQKVADAASGKERHSGRDSGPCKDRPERGADGEAERDGGGAERSAERGARGRSEAAGDARGAREDGRAFGQSTASEARESARDEGRAFGQSTAERAKDLAPKPGPPTDRPDPAGPPEGSPPASSGSRGAERSARGRGDADDTAGPPRP